MQDIMLRLFGENNTAIIVLLGYVAIKVNKISVDFQVTKDRSIKNERKIEDLEKDIERLEIKEIEIKREIEELKELINAQKR